MTSLTREEFGELFTSFKRTALRLEVRDRYEAEVEREPLRKFFAGEPDDLAWAQEWFAMVRKAASEGKVFRRVRMVSVPLSDYSRYGLWFAKHTIDAGEDIRYLERTRAGDLPDFDYWLFDAAKAVRFSFDDDDRPVSMEVISDATTVSELAAAMDIALARSVTRDQFAEAHGLG